MAADALNVRWARVLVDECVAAGIRHAVICPGSRSTPLALACAGHSNLTCHSVIDERSAAYVALGIAKAHGVPALLIATSGTAGAHFYPAVMEAHAFGVPLLAITADRPIELLDWGAPQTIRQSHLYGSFARWFCDLGLPEDTEDRLRHLRATVARAVHEASVGGAVQLNAPFREPLAPKASDDPEASATLVRSQLRFTRPNTVDDRAIEQLAEWCSSVREGLIVVGPRDADDGLGRALVQLSKVTGYPIFAEAASNVRFGNGGAGVVAHYDALLRSAEFAKAHRPRLVLRLGGGLTPKGVQAYLAESHAVTALFAERGDVHDPSHAASLILSGNPVDATVRLAERVSPSAQGWRDGFLKADARVAAELDAWALEDGPLDEPVAARTVVQALPAGAALMVASSMPIRDVDAFASASTQPLRVFSNRGVNGIEGTVSTAIGAALALRRPTAVITGDVAFLHDLGALLTAQRLGVSLTVIIVNNDGGGIFSFLPVAERTPHFEQLFGTPHGLTFQSVANQFAARYQRVDTAEALAEAVRVGCEGGLNVIEVQVPTRGVNVERHRALFERTSRALEEQRWS